MRQDKTCLILHSYTRWDLSDNVRSDLSDNVRSDLSEVLSEVVLMEQFQHGLNWVEVPETVRQFQHGSDSAKPCCVPIVVNKEWSWEGVRWEASGRKAWKADVGPSVKVLSPSMWLSPHASKTQLMFREKCIVTHCFVCIASQRAASALLALGATAQSSMRLTCSKHCSQTGTAVAHHVKWFNHNLWSDSQGPCCINCITEPYSIKTTAHLSDSIHNHIHVQTPQDTCPWPYSIEDVIHVGRRTQTCLQVLWLCSLLITDHQLQWHT